MKLTLGYSPCPNDTFIFDAMIHGKIDTEGLEFDVLLADVEQLNQMAFNGELDITKLSYHAYAYLIDQYVLLDAGSALGNNCGPLLIAKEKMDRVQIQEARIAIPGKFTTANFLLSLAYPQATHKKELLFSEIESAVLSSEVDAGLIIHENRFTYQEKGLQKLIDLGAFWEDSTGHPIPLGGIVIQRQMDKNMQQRVNRVLKRSIQYAFDNPSSSMEYVRTHAQEMDEEVMAQHIQLYVNNYTLDLGQKGKAAVNYLFEKAWSQEIIPSSSLPIFLEKD